MAYRPLVAQPGALVPAVELRACPLIATAGILGHKWTLILLRDAHFLKLDRFSQFLDNNPGLSRRMLALRLREMVAEGLFEKKADGEPRYRLTSRGEEALVVVLAVMQYTMREHAKEIFTDARPREVAEVFPSERERLALLARSVFERARE